MTNEITYPSQYKVNAVILDGVTDALKKRGIKARVHDCYWDYGANTAWTTILVDGQDGYGEYQLLCPRVQEALAHLVPDDIIDETDFDDIARMLIEHKGPVEIANFIDSMAITAA